MSFLIRIALVLTCAGVVAAPTAMATYLDVVFTADNVIAAWYQNGSDPNPLSTEGLENLGTWQHATEARVDLAGWGHYTLIFEVENLGSPSSDNPAGFLAEVSGPGVSGDLLSRGIPFGSGEEPQPTMWEWAPTSSGPGENEPNFGEMDWQTATSYGRNGDNTKWYQVNNGPVDGISLDAQWIWNEFNFGQEQGDPIYVRGEFYVTPEPSILAILGVGLAIVGVARLRRR